ncbi:hypothetical protein FRAHR75_1420005 [Frankia sp. Hr75.2]|nr:hypothetical protein FRAHR75_1420005 [Frankia sp. Hr75.2]
MVIFLLAAISEQLASASPIICASVFPCASRGNSSRNLLIYVSVPSELPASVPGLADTYVIPVEGFVAEFSSGVLVVSQAASETTAMAMAMNAIRPLDRERRRRPESVGAWISAAPSFLF